MNSQTTVTVYKTVKIMVIENTADNDTETPIGIQNCDLKSVKQYSLVCKFFCFVFFG